jgi:chitinase
MWGSGDTCSAIAAEYTLTVDEMDNFNNNTWGWYGCDELQAGQVICLSNGTAPYPMAIANAVCGPQVPGTNFTGTDSAADWASLNPCPLNACCDIWGECGASPDYCNDTLAASGAPGTAPTGSNGCIFNCGTDIVKNATAPTAYSAVGYFEAYNGDRSCLNMDAISIDPTKYTHVHFAFANITLNFSISVAGQEQQFEYFKELAGMKRIVSFGGWDFSTNIDTYMIFREGVAAANRDTLVNNLVEFVSSNALDGVDFDWEYPGEPDIPGIPAGSDEYGSNYLAFLQALRTALPDKSISISAPASYYYLKAFPIAAIAEVVDHVFYMTYDLHGTWDLGNGWAQNGCSAGDCLFSHVNLTETMWVLSMITKAPVATSSIMVGVTSYGRSFEMTTVGCYTSDCTWDAAGSAGPCSDTAGYIDNAEINQILADDSSGQQIFSSDDDSDILVYNETQWVAYMTNTTKSTRTAYYQTFNFAGTSEWAIDLEEYQFFSYTDGTDTGMELLELSAYSNSLNLDVNYNLSCINLRRGDNTSAQLEEYVVPGALKIDAILYEYKGKTNVTNHEQTSNR